MDEKSIAEEMSKYGLEGYTISFDTYNKTYNIQIDMKAYLGIQNESQKDAYTLSLFKYVSMDTYMNMLNNKTFRMNSIVSMNDKSESIWASKISGNNVQIEDDNYLMHVLQNRNTLITSFTSLRDDATMWRLYGNNGNGVCLAFDVEPNQVTKIQYVREDDPKFRNLKNITDALRSKGITITFYDLKDIRYFIKSASFSIEGEYRYIYASQDDSLRMASYSGLLTLYKDFDWDFNTNSYVGLPFHFKGVYIGGNLEFDSVNRPLLHAKTHEVFPSIFIYDSKVRELR